VQKISLINPKKLSFKEERRSMPYFSDQQRKNIYNIPTFQNSIQWLKDITAKNGK